MTESEMQLCVIRHYWPRNTFCPNIGIACGEADLLMLTPAGLVTEFEIKVTRADFRADARKELKHKWYSYAFSRQQPVCQWVNGIDRPISFLPNRFIYAVPAELKLTPADVPIYAGLWTWDGLYWTAVKPEPYLHKVKLEWGRKIARGLWMRYAERVMLRNE